MAEGPVRLRATITWEYDANPESYSMRGWDEGRRATPEEMAVIDAAASEADPCELFEATAPADAKLTVEVVDEGV